MGEGRWLRNRMESVWLRRGCWVGGGGYERVRCQDGRPVIIGVGLQGLMARRTIGRFREASYFVKVLQAYLGCSTAN